jgi:hypothetical protein
MPIVFIENTRKKSRYFLENIAIPFIIIVVTL